MSAPRFTGSSDFDVIALTGSAGAGSAGLRLLRDLSADSDVPVVVAFHLAPESALVEVYSKLRYRVEWAIDGAFLEPGKILVCPPRHILRLLPDGTCTLAPAELGTLDRPLDRFLESVARSFASRAIGIVLTGMGKDAAAGALELHRAGGQVIVQSESSAEYPAMPAAAIAAGAADIVIPLSEAGHLVGELLTNTPRLRMRSELDVVRRVFGEQGEMAARARQVDWSRTPLGPAVEWPETLRSSVRTMMDAPDAQALWWGPELVQFYNDGWRGVLGTDKHPQAFGARARDTWADIWHEIGPRVERVMATGVAEGGVDSALFVRREDYVEEVFADFSYAPLRSPSGAVVAVCNHVRDTTRHVVSERRLRTLRDLASQSGRAQGIRDACERVAAVLAGADRDLPFALFYMLDMRWRRATLLCAAGVPSGGASAPHTLGLDGQGPWPLARALEPAAGERGGVLLQDLASRCTGLAPVASGPQGATPPRGAVLHVLRAAAGEPPLGVVVLGLSPHRRFDEGYRSFVDLAVQQMCVGIGQGRAVERERERLERLAEVDRAKTEFFANVSHEFRTPLTLLLAPLEELMRRKADLPAELVEDVEVAGRNARRLLTLVSNLLDFSQMESRRQPAQLTPADLRTLTTDIASHFRSAIESAGLALRMEFDPQLPPVPVDPEMWAAVVSNLLSNALKFTFDGEISIAARALRLHAEVVVSDSGVGIPPNEVGNVFKRFHRVRGARARTAEGAGIGLSIVQDLVQRMGGQVQVRSVEGRGSSFVIWLPYKSQRMPAADPGPAVPATLQDRTIDLADQAARWGAEETPEGILPDILGAPAARAGPVALERRDRIVVADDNADMRSYLRRLLGDRWEVTACGDGTAAFEAVRRLRPGLVLADVALQGADGFELLRRIRADPLIEHTPVVFLAARAGEAAAIEGLTAGADDYIAKPFSPRELLARVAGQLELTRLRRRTAETHAFLVRFSDAIRPLAEPREVAQTALRMLGEQLGADGAHWTESGDGDEDREGYAISGSYRAAAAEPVDFARFAEKAYDPWAAQFQAGRSAVVDGVHGIAAPVAPADAEPEAASAASAVTAHISVPVLVQGDLRAVLSVHQRGHRRWTAEEVALAEGVAGRLWAEFERARAEAVARTSQERQAFLLRLSDALRARADPAEIRLAAATLLGEHLGSSRVAYAEDEGDGQHFTVTRNYVDGAAQAVGRFRYADYGPDILDDLQAGRTRVQPDIASDVRLSARERDALARHGVGASLNLPLVKAGRLVAFLGINYPAAHAFGLDEIDLASEVAERTWAAVERARAEEDLRESRQRFRALVSASATSIYRMSPDWRVLYQLDSESFSSTAEPIEDWVREYIPEEDHPVVFAAIAQAIGRKSLFELEHRVRRADGGVGWVLSRAVPLLDAAGEITEWFGAGSDTTARRAAVEQLRDSEERHREALERRVRERTAELAASHDLLQATMDSSHDMIQVFEAVRDASGAIVDFRWIINNRKSEEVYGDVLGRNLLENNPGVVAAGIFDAFKRVVESGEPHQGQYRYAHEQFDSWFFQSAVRLGDGVATTTTDIGPWKAAQAEVQRLQQDVVQARLQEAETRLEAVFDGAVRRSEERLRNAMEVGRLGLWDWNIATGAIYWSGEHFRMEGYAVGEVVPSYEAWAARLHPEDRAATEAALREAMDGNGEYMREFRVVHPDGAVRWMHARGRFLRDDDGRAVRMIGVMLDATEWHRPVA
ncbi:MAG: PAS domain-containing protein [Xylophilus ampelinus]